MSVRRMFRIAYIAAVMMSALCFVAFVARNLQEEKKKKSCCMGKAAKLEPNLPVMVLSVGPGPDAQDFDFVQLSAKITHAHLYILNPYDTDTSEPRPEDAPEEYLQMRCNGAAWGEKLNMSTVPSRTNVDLQCLLGTAPVLNALDTISIELTGGEGVYRTFGVALGLRHVG